MPLKYQVEALDQIPEPLHEFYREDNGKYVLDAEGVKPAADFERVNTALAAERKVSKQFKDAAAAWEAKIPGKNPDEIAALLERIPLLEAESQGKWDQKKHLDVLETTVKQRVAPLELELTKRQQAIVERDQVIEQYKTADRKRTIHDAVRAMAAKEGFQESAYANPEGALMLLAERHFTVNAEGHVVVSDDSKSLQPGLAVREALGELKTQHPYLLKQSLGGGATGGNNPGLTGSNPFKGNNFTARSKYIEANPDKWQSAMAQAGLTDKFQKYNPK